MDRINNIIELKKTKICLAADVNTMEELFNLISILGDKICILKIHYDIISDFHDNFNYNCIKLNKLKKEYNFLIWEDSKFADIGYINKLKIQNHISFWADIISIHPIAGEKSIIDIKDIDIILIGEMSSENNLFNHEYQHRVIEIAEKHDNVVGIVCQHKMSDKVLNVTPGISIKDKKDNFGQVYNSPLDRKFADIFVIGRAICKSDNPLKAINEILNIINID